MTSWARLLLAALPLALAAGIGAAGAAEPRIDPRRLELLSWRELGPGRGGRSVAAVGHPTNRLVAFMGATGGGLWRTDDGGASWRNVSDGFFRRGSVGAVDVSRSQPDVVYVGMGEACFRNDVSPGDGVYKSTDGGRSWTHAGLGATRFISRVRIHPRDPQTVYVAALGDGFGPSSERGVYRTRDGGARWTKVLDRGADAGAIDLALDPNDPAVLYAAFLELRRYPWGLRSAGPGSGLFKSADGGDTWTDLTNAPGLPQGIKGRIGVSASARRGRVYAIVDGGENAKGVYRSDDGGARFTLTSDFAELTQRAWYYHHVVADPIQADTVYVLNEDLYRSTDAGATWTLLPVPHNDVHDMWIDPDDPRHLVHAGDGGGTVSFDGGRSWSTTLNQPTAQIYHVTTDTAFPYRVYGAQQDNTSISLPIRSDRGSIGPSDWRAEAAGEAGYLAVHPLKPHVVYGGDHHWLYRLDHRTAEWRDISPNPETHYGWGARDINYRFKWTYPVLLSPHDPEVLYAAAQVVFRSRDEGQSWEIASPDLTRADPETLEPTPSHKDPRVGRYWGPITRDNTGVEWYGTIFALAESPLRRGVLWSGSDDGYVQLSQDDGRSWRNVTPRGLPEFALISTLEPSPHDAGAAYLAATRYMLQDHAPYLYKTTDYGASWTRIDAGIPRDDFTRVVRADPARRGVLYAGTETTVHLSLDDGASWQPLTRNLPPVPVHDLAVKDGDLIAATHGRGFWVLDNAALVHQLADAGAGQPFALFAPRPTVRFAARLADAQREDYPLGPDSFVAKNPPAGAVIPYFLEQAPAGSVVIEILDAGGAVVRRFTSDTKPAAPARAGANLFQWDLRYPAPDTIPGTTLHRTPRGALAPPGRYQARLSVSGRSASAAFEVVRDPRSRWSDADLHEQFRFLSELGETLRDTHALVRGIRGMRERAARAGLGGDARAIEDELLSIEELLTQYRARAPKDLSNYPSGLDNKLVVLQDLAARADAPPTRAARERLAAHRATLARQAARLEGVRASAAWLAVEQREGAAR